MKRIKLFFTNFRAALFELRMEWEFCHCIAPHVHGEKDYGYQFDTLDEMEALAETYDVRACLDRIEAKTRQMPKGYGQSFRYIMRRDLMDDLRQYEKLARKNIYPQTSDQRLVAKRA